jgi:hypothetical protein
MKIIFHRDRKRTYTLFTNGLVFVLQSEQSTNLSSFPLIHADNIVTHTDRININIFVARTVLYQVLTVDYFFLSSYLYSFSHCLPLSVVLVTANYDLLIILKYLLIIIMYIYILTS